MKSAERIATWRQARNHVAIGNLGEQVCGRLLVTLDYQLLGTQAARSASSTPQSEQA